jgi:hypothetical protein
MSATKRIFGQNEIYILESTYIQSIKRGRDNTLEIEIAGPNYYDNVMTLEGFEEEELLKAFQPPTFINRSTGKKVKYGDREDVPDLEHIRGHSIQVYYQEGKVIGFSVI